MIDNFPIQKLRAWVLHYKLIIIIITYSYPTILNWTLKPFLFSNHQQPRRFFIDEWLMDLHLDVGSGLWDLITQFLTT